MLARQLLTKKHVWVVLHPIINNCISVIVCFFLLFLQEDIAGNDGDQCMNQSEINNKNRCAMEVRTYSSDEEEIKNVSNSEDDTEAGITNREVEEVMQDVARKNCGSSSTCW